MKIGIVGSRSFPQAELVEWFVSELPGGVTVVSGGARGVDSVAEEAARKRGLPVEVYRPDVAGCTARHEFTQRYYARNQRIVDASDLVVAFTEKDSGGTWHTIKQAKKAGVPIKIIRPAPLFDRAVDRDDQQAEHDADVDQVEDLERDDRPERPVSAQQAARDARKGQGPFSIKRAALGSYALRRKSYIGSEEWLEIVTLKETDPAALAAKIVPDMLRFFEDYPPGILHALSVPPRSVRNLDRPHTMDIVGRDVAEALRVPFVRMFEPWTKSTRGRHAQPGEIVVTDQVRAYVGKVVFVVDDVYTSGRTMRAAVQSLLSLEVHAHGLAWVYMA